MKKILIASILLLTVCWSSNVSAATFSDVSEKHGHYKDIMTLHEKGIINGYANGTFKPNASITKAQAATIIVRALNLQQMPYTNPNYQDVSTKHSAYKEIAIATNLGLFTKKENFKPGAAITRAEMAKVIVKGFNLVDTQPYSPFMDVQQDDEYFPYILSLYTYDITKGYANGSYENYYKPENTLTRSQFSALLNRTLTFIENNDAEIDTIESVNEDNIVIHFEEAKDSCNHTYEIFMNNKKINAVTTCSPNKPSSTHNIFLNERFYGDYDVRVNVKKNEKIIATYTQVLSFKQDLEKPTFKEITFFKNRYGTIYIQIHFDEDVEIPTTLQNIELKYTLTNRLGEKPTTGRYIPMDVSQINTIANYLSYPLLIEYKQEWPLQFSIKGKEDVLVVDEYGNKGPKEMHIQFTGTSLDDLTYDVESVY